MGKQPASRLGRGCFLYLSLSKSTSITSIPVWIALPNNNRFFWLDWHRSTWSIISLDSSTGQSSMRHLSSAIEYLI